MSCFFGCFRAKNNHDSQPPVAVDPLPTTTRKATVSQNQLSDLFASQEIEELSCRHEKITQPESVDIQCKDMEVHKVVGSNKQPLQPWTPAKPFKLKSGLHSLEETPTSCISDPPNDPRNSVNTTETSEKGNFSASIMHLCHTNKETLASQTLSTSNNECESDTSSSSTVVSSSFPDAHASNNQKDFDAPSNESYSLQKRKNGPASSQKHLQVQESISSCPKQMPRKKVGNKVNIQAELAAREHSGRNPGDMPKLRTIKTPWNEEFEPSPVPLKWWNGNGIPNSTNKYREDQIVSWDVTPFEERLEKALSEVNSISQSRTHSSGAHVAFEDKIDTAASKLQSFPRPKSVVSF
ncbi:unnamed protein product [Rhodiola kirilowii]